MPNQPWDYIAKLVCIGDSGTGKSSLTIRLCEGRFSPLHDVTIGVEFGSRIVPVGPPASLELGINDPAAATASFPSTSPHASSAASSATAVAPPPPPSTLSLPRPPARPEQQKRMKLSLWDTAGQETYRAITRSYFRGAGGALLVFDIARRPTFDAATHWLRDLRQIAEDGIVVVLVGNKSDLAEDDEEDDGGGGDGDGGNAGAAAGDAGREPAGAAAGSAGRRAVTRAEAEAWCARHGVLRYVETSAKSGAGVERAFREVAERIYQNIEAGRYDLTDRRSGVKGPAAGAGGAAGAGAGGRGAGAGAGMANHPDNSGQAVLLGMNSVGGMGVGKKGWGSCCSG